MDQELEDFGWALHFTLPIEGGFVDNPADPGGATNKGITQGTYNGYRSKKGLPHRSVREIEDGEVAEIYRTLYWLASGADKLPRPLNLCVFDCAVNSGPSRAKSILESARETEDDQGHPLELDLQKDRDEIAQNYLDDRHDYFEAIVQRRPRSQRFLHGWLDRLTALAKYATIDWP